ncbi:MAG: 50S ribosomal protein L32 [Spirochaetota bacterium]|nr:50S ribosomal protein L32 [Spirochaetota bacterium]
MAVPKQKKSKSKSRSQRAFYLKMKVPTLSKCPSCGAARLPHAVCHACGYYKNKIVVNYSE